MDLEKKLILSDGSFFIFKNKKLHSNYGPALYDIKQNKCLYYINGEQIKTDIWIKDYCLCPDDVKVELILTYGI